VVEIEAATYAADVAVWRANRLTLKGVGGRPHITGDGRHAEGKGIWVIKGDDVTVENVEMSGARVPDGNGAAIRAEGRNLTLRRVYLHDNENGLLGGKPAGGSLTLVEYSDFARNGTGDGQTHNMYVGSDELVVRGCYLHHARSGHQVKSRAATTRILYSVLADGPDGNSSYLVDVPNGGRAFLVGNLLQQGPRTENFHLVSYGHEGIRHPRNALVVRDNTFVNDRPGGGVFLRNVGATEVRVRDNRFYGPGQFVGDMGTFEGNVSLPRPPTGSLNAGAVEQWRK